MNRFAIIADIHANYEALQSVLEAIEVEGIDDIFCCGDVIGYGADANKTVEEIRRVAKDGTILGNHDAAVLKSDNGFIDFFNPLAKQAVQYHKEVLTEENVLWLGNLPESLHFEQFYFCHASPGDVHNYLATENDFHRAFGSSAVQGSWISFFGHTHMPACINCDGLGIISFEEIASGRDTGDYEIPLFDDLRYFINPGSVGQPRDENPKASFAIFDMERKTIAFRRVSYDIDLAMAKIIAAGLPEHLAVRLKYGC